MQQDSANIIYREDSAMIWGLELQSEQGWKTIGTSCY